MCTNYVLIKSDGSAKLAESLGVDANRLIYGDFRPGAQISVVTGGSEARLLRTATWWLYLQQTQEGLRPHRDYFSVNTNYRKLPQKREFKHSRCIIPATAFVESQDGKRPHLLEPANGTAIAFGGAVQRMDGQGDRGGSYLRVDHYPAGYPGPGADPPQVHAIVVA